MPEIEFLTIHDLIKIGERLIPDFKIRDYGLLESSAHRPHTIVFGESAYGAMSDKAAALMHSIARNPALVDGNKRLAWSAARTFCLLNHLDIYLKIDDAEELVVGIASGKYHIAEIAERLNIK